MKSLFLIVFVLFTKMSIAETTICEPINTGGRVVLNYSNQTNGLEAGDEFTRSIGQAETSQSLETLSGFFVVKLTTVHSDLTTDSGVICKKFRRAKLSRVCHNILVDRSVYCSDQCEQSSWSEDCR